MISGHQQNRGLKRPSNHGQSGKGNSCKWFKANPGPTLEADTAFEADSSLGPTTFDADAGDEYPNFLGL